MNITIDFEGALQRALAPESINPILDKHLKDAITRAIDEATGYRSEFQKALKEQLSAALPHGLGIDDVAKFGHILNGAIQTLVGEANKATIEAAMKKAIAHVMPDVPAVVKLSEFMEEARGGLHKDPHEAFYAFMDDAHGFTHIYFDSDERPGSSPSYQSREGMKYRADYSLGVTKDGEVYSLKLNGKDVTPTSVPDVIGRFDSILMSMYVGRTKLEIDMDDDDLESLSAEQYD